MDTTPADFPEEPLLPRDAFPALRHLYAEADNLATHPALACPTQPEMTLVEFTFLADAMATAWNDAEWKHFLHAPAPHPESPHAAPCPCHDRNACRLADARPLACRVVDADDHPTRRDDADNDAVEALAHACFHLSTQFGGMYEEPYWISVLTLDCWLAIAFDPRMSQPQIMGLRALIRNSVNLERQAEWYRDRTGLARKLGFIELFFDETEHRRPAQALRAITRVRDGFPHTGRYYRTEAERYARLMERIVERKKPA